MSLPMPREPAARVLLLLLLQIEAGPLPVSYTPARMLRPPDPLPMPRQPAAGGLLLLLW